MWTVEARCTCLDGFHLGDAPVDWRPYGDGVLLASVPVDGPRTDQAEPVGLIHRTFELALRHQLGRGEVLLTDDDLLFDGCRRGRRAAGAG